MELYGENTIQLINHGRQDCSDMHSQGPCVLSCYIIHYVIRGTGYLEYDKKHYRISAGESFLIYPYVMIRYYPDPQDPWEYTWVDFVGRQTPDYLSACQMNRTAPVCPFIEAERILPLFEKLTGMDLYHTNKLEANGILLTLLGLYADAFPAVKDSLPSREDNRLAAAITLIHSNYRHDDFNIEKLCEQMHCNRVTLYRLFQNNLQVSPGSYLASYRIKQACKMLELGTSVKTAALSCGFTDQFYFSRAFKQHMGVSPAEYKKDSLNI